MRTFTVRSSGLGAVLPLLLLALPASADPILNVSTNSIALSPTQTVITFSIDPNGMLVAGVSLTFSPPAADILIVDIQSVDPGNIDAFPPIPPGNDASFSGLFLDRSAPFDVGTLTVVGLTPGTPLVVNGSYVISDGAVPIPNLSDLFFGPLTVATVVSTPEPTSAALLSLGILALAIRRRGNG